MHYLVHLMFKLDPTKRIPPRVELTLRIEAKSPVSARKLAKVEAEKIAADSHGVWDFIAIKRIEEWTPCTR